MTLTDRLALARQVYAPWFSIYEEVYGPLTDPIALTAALSSLKGWYHPAANEQEGP